MKQSILSLALFFAVQLVFGQIVPSSCTAHDSIIAKYRDDADRLALKKIYFYNLSYTDSIEIPKTHSDTVLNALIAVYNATTLPARDTVIDLFDIHTFPDLVMNKIAIVADSNLFWMQQLKNGIIPTGHSSLDNLLDSFYLSIDIYNTYLNSFNWHEVIFITDSNYNILPMTLLFNTVPGVNYSSQVGTIGDGNNITAEVFSNYVELVYSHGWEDCLAGCVFRRYWKFKVDYSCNVEYVGSYGTSFIITKMNDFNGTSVTFAPNPFKQTITINGISEPFNYSITNLIGQELLKGKSSNSRIENIAGLNSGIYLLLIHTASQVGTFKIIKE